MITNHQYTYFILPDTSGHLTDGGETVIADIPVTKEDVVAYFGGYWKRCTVADALCQQPVDNHSTDAEEAFLRDYGWTRVLESDSPPEEI
jgi:hypothetical protein